MRKNTKLQLEYPYNKKWKYGYIVINPENRRMEKYGVWQLKKLYGREYYGVVRSTFLINPEGKIVAKWSNVKVNGHVDKVLTKLQELIKG